MTSLYPDDSYCNTDIGRIIFHAKSDWLVSSRVTSYDEEKHLAGSHTVYTVEITCTPCGAFRDHATRTFYLTTRYKELHKLHQALTKLHKQLYLRGTFPTFPAPRFLGSGDPTVIEERRSATDVFLNFVFDSEVLRKARLLHDFVDKSRERAHTAREASPDAFLYDSAANILDAPNTRHEDRTTSPVLTPTTAVPQAIGDRFLHREESDANLSNASGDFQFPDVSIEDTQTCASAREKRKTSTMKKLFPRLNSSNYAAQSQEESDTSDYLVRAGQLVATAQRAEEEHAYELAFQCYKNAASSLIQGVQLECDMTRRNAVRRKTAKYLVKAEKLYRTYLSYDGSVFNIDALLTSSMQDPNVLAFQCSNKSLKNYRFIGVLPCIEAMSRVLLVEEKSSEKKFVMKLIEKGENGKGRILLPTNVPHMAQLVQFFEIEHHIVLLLEYSEPGRLWNFLSRYFCDAESRFLLSLSDTRVEVKKSVDSEDTESIEIDRKAENNYRGRRLLFTVGVDFERIVAMRDEAQSTDDPWESSGVVCSVGEDATGRSDAPTGEFCIVGQCADALEGQHLNVCEEAPAAIKFDFAQQKSNTGTSTQKVSDAGSSKNADEVYDSDLDSEAFSRRLATTLHDVRHQIGLRRKMWPPHHELAECLVVHWCAQLVSFLYILHNEHIEYIGDLQPENILLDTDGNLLMTYHGRWYDLNSPLKLLEGYAAPESSEYGWKPSAASDVWSLGALTFELACGRSLANAAPHGVQRSGELPFPEDSKVSFAARDVITMMLQPSPARRASLEDIRAHPFFRHVDWSLYDNPSSHLATSSSTCSFDKAFDNPPLAPELLMSSTEDI